MSEPAAIRLIEGILRRNRDRHLLFSLVGAMAGLALLSLHWPLSPMLNIICDLIGLAIASACVWIAFRTLGNWSLSDAELIRLMRNEPDQVAWVYHMVIESVPFGIKTLESTTLYVHCLDGSRQQLAVKSGEAEEVLAALAKFFPEATFGHSVEKEQLYRANPQLLVRNRAD